MGLQNVVPQSRIFFEYPSVVIQPSSFRQAWLRILSANTICSLHYLRGEYEIRTRDLLLARQALSQLSYTPKLGLSGLEPPTSRLSGVRSNRLSYKPFLFKSGGHLLSHTVSSAVPSAA